MAAVGLHPAALRRALRILDENAALRASHEADEGDDDDRAANDGEDRAAAHRAFADLREHLREAARQLGEAARDRKSVGSGKSVSVRVDHGGRRNIKEKKTISRSAKRERKTPR